MKRIFARLGTAFLVTVAIAFLVVVIAWLPDGDPKYGPYVGLGFMVFVAIILILVIMATGKRRNDS